MMNFEKIKEGASLVKEQHLNGCFGDLYVSQKKSCFFCVCNTAGIESSQDCPFFHKGIKIRNFGVQVAGFGISAKFELGENLKEEVK